MTDIRDLDTASFAAAVGHAAAARAFEIMADEGADPNLWFCDGWLPPAMTAAAAEGVVQWLGAYVTERVARGGTVSGEALFIRAGMEGMHAFPASRWSGADAERLRASYGLFAPLAVAAARHIEDEKAHWRPSPEARPAETLTEGGGAPPASPSDTAAGVDSPTPATAADEPLPVADEPLPVADEPVPVADEPVPVADEPLPVADEPVPVADEPLPVPVDSRGRRRR